MSNAYLCMDTYTHITIHLYLNMLQSYWYKCTKSPPHTDTQMQRHTDAETHTHTSVADSLLSPLSLPTPESLSCFFCCSMSSTLQTQDTGHTPDTHTGGRHVCVCMHRRDKEQGSHNDREGDRERMLPLPSLLLMLRSHCCVNSDWLFGFNL